MGITASQQDSPIVVIDSPHLQPPPDGGGFFGAAAEGVQLPISRKDLVIDLPLRVMPETARLHTLGICGHAARPPLLSVMTHRHTCFAVLSSALLAGGMVLPPPSHSQYDSVSSPSKGVLCDRSSQICYDAQGISLGLTRENFGPAAERRLMAELSGRPAPKEFRLSNGAVCSVPLQQCWSDGFAKRQISREMTRDLFGRLPGAISNDREVSRFTGFCTLAQGGRQLYDGPCALRRITRDNSGITRYVVIQQDGRRFNFSNRSGRLEVSDGTGDAPVAFFDHGFTGVFRWRDMTLVATREHRGLRQSRDNRVIMDQLFLDP